MKLPIDKVDVFGVVYIFFWDESLPDDSDAGKCYLSTQRIGLNAYMGEDALRDTVMHETIHAIWWLMGLPDKAKEEDAVRQLSIGLGKVARDNPKWARYVYSIR